MAGVGSKRSSVFFVLLLVASWGWAQRPQTGRTVRRHRVAEGAPPVSPLVTQAESALDKKDFAAAEKLLTDVVAKDAADFRAWFDLGYLYHATQRDTQAKTAYEEAATLKPTLFEANLRLGQILLRQGDQAGAIKSLRAATNLKPENQVNEKLGEAWLSLGQALQSTEPQEAISAYRQSVMLAPTAEPHLAIAKLLEQQKDPAGAEAEFKAALQIEPQSLEALARVLDIYTGQKRWPEAEAMLQQMLQREPGNASAGLQLGRVLIAENKRDEGIARLEATARAFPHDGAIMLELGRAYVAAQRFDTAAEMYHDSMLATKPGAQELYEYGVVLRKARRFTEAQQQLIHAIEMDPKMTEAYGELAVAASEAKNYPLVLKVLEARAKLAPDTPGTFFMRATAYDNLRANKEAAESYHRFLESAQGKYPDQEWQARHRLITIEKKK